MLQVPQISQEDILKLLDACYVQTKNGLPRVSAPIEQFAEDYLRRERDPQKAAKAMLKNQIAKCTTSGFLTGFCGAITLPVESHIGISSFLQINFS